MLGQTETEQERAVGVLAISALVGGGVIAYEAARAIGEGDLLKVEQPEKKEISIPEGAMMGLLTFGGLYLTYESLKEAARDVGMTPLVLGGVGMTGLAGIIWLRNR
jgi:hypothetical protein